MRYRRFGKTDFRFSIFSLGTMGCLASPSIAYKTIYAAIEAGINHLETARAYGSSETYLGQALKKGLPRSREQLYITTKLLPTPDPQKMSQEIDQSLQHLQVDYLDCLAIHGVNTWEHFQWLINPQGCMKAVKDVIAAGKVRQVGFSTHAPLEIILATINTNLFSFVNLHYYYFFQRNAPAVQLAYEKDMGVFIISPGDKGGKLYTPSETLQQLCEPFSPLALNYRFLLSDHRISTLSMGPANPHELPEPLQVADQDGPLTPQEKEVLQRLEIELDQKLATDKCSQCYQCLPCPEEIHIPEILRLRNLAEAYDMQNYGQYRYQMLENAGHWFPGKKGNRCTECGDCLPRCPEKLAIPSLLEDAHQSLNGKPRRRLWG